MIKRQQTHAYQILRLLFVVTVATATQSASAANMVAWSGDGEFRLLVRIEESGPANRRTDELPADVQIEFAAELEKLGIDGLPDIASLQVMQYDPETGRPKRYGNYAYGRGPNDRPLPLVRRGDSLPVSRLQQHADQNEEQDRSSKSHTCRLLLQRTGRLARRATRVDSHADRRHPHTLRHLLRSAACGGKASVNSATRMAR